ncbi:tetratricopeptide repeat protein [Marilutibacter chinensis]|uniref:Sel1 repeat family protein n=1 Tax=Marilutibacter chinensis TaxID=2912247 RepID=A0ABS9HTR8_9GAMM|nr:hypothetical protein [Lysobacter chinensis]MCF7221555.1 hypothetical protein [Lysobacter chinensis]
MNRKFALPALLWLAMGSSPAIAGGAEGPADTRKAAATATRAGTEAGELAMMNGVSTAWDRYVEASNGDPAEAVSLMSRSALRDSAFTRDAALYGSIEQVRRLPLSKQFEVYVLRALYDADRLQAMDAGQVARACIEAEVCGIASPDEGEAPPRLTHVTLVGEGRAIGELAPPTGEQYQFGPEFAYEDGAWKVSIETQTVNESMLLKQLATQAGLTEPQLVEAAIATMLETRGPPPALALLERPLIDDPAARTRLTENWPDYSATFKARVLAVEKKAERGEDMAMFLYGSMLYLGNSPEFVDKDVERGLALLERASEAGNDKAALLVGGHLMYGDDLPEDAPPPAERLARAARHMRRAANGGHAQAMVALGLLYANGAGDLPRDCRTAESWLARAEEAGIEHARNNRVWVLATCPIPEQRDPQRALELADFMIRNAGTLAAGELDTVAAAYAANAHYDDAVDYQTRAIAELDDDQTETTRKEMQERLARYVRHEDWVQAYNVYETAR